MAKEKRKYTGRKIRRKWGLKEQKGAAEELMMKTIAIKLLLEEVPDTYLPQAPLIRGTVDLTLDAYRKWIDRISKAIEEDAEKK